jgi:hypothetical protein
MRNWIGSIVLVVGGAFALASGCSGQPEVIRRIDVASSTRDASLGGGSDGNGGPQFGDSGISSSCPSTCNQLNADCGFVTDARCGGVTQCAATCPSGQICGGSKPNRCGTGTLASDSGTCVPSTCAELNANCGFVTDTKCGGTVQCGKCAAGNACGLGGANKCGPTAGDGGTCTVDPTTTCAGRGFTCGQAADNCGTLLDCGSTTCPVAGQTCVQGVCAAQTCVVDPKTTCAGRGYTCGQAADNCGHLLTCGPSTCSTPGWTCGGGSDISGNPIAGVCGCTGVCSQIPSCPAGTSTTLSGKVYDPAGKNALYHVLVYVANNPKDPDLKNFPAGVTCDVCGASAAGSPLISTPGSSDPPAGTYTGVDGTFKLDNVPVGKGISVVIQLGRWRRVFTVDINTSCGANTVPDKTFLMPSQKSQGNIPLMAMVTGDADSLECVLRKMGINGSEFTDPAGNGRVQFYLGTGNAGQSIDPATPNQDALFQNGANNQPVINGYDMAILACQGAAYAETAPNQLALRNYADSGGRVFSTHYSYTWLYQNDANAAAAAGTVDNWSEVAKWHVDENDRAATATGIIDKVSNPKGNAFQGWLEAVGASTVGSGTVGVVVIRHDTDLISAVAGQTQQWLYRLGTAPNYTGMHTPLHFTFNTPVNLKEDLTKTPPVVQCGRVLFSDFHVQDAAENGKVFPAQCGAACTTDANCTGTCANGLCPWGAACKTNADCASTCSGGRCLDPMNAQEKLLEFMIFDLGSCVPPPKTCVPAVKCPAGQDCGYAPDGCGGLIPCGTCPSGESCGVGQPPVPNKCGKVTCTPATACPAAQQCGYASDGCSGVILCGTCPAGQSCSGGKCGSNTCTPETCTDQGIECGQAGDQCGKQLQCPACPTGDSCIAGKCVPQICVPQSCSKQGIECGPAADGCGQMISSCGICAQGVLCIAGKCTQIK